MSLDAIIFVLSAVVAVFGATMMIVQRNPVASVLYLIVSLIAQAVLYIQLGTAFMGAVLVIVYAGAILVLFLFVIMLLNLRGREDLGEGSAPLSRLTKYLVSLLFVVELVFVIRAGFFAETAVVGVFAGGAVADDFGSVEHTAGLLFTRYLYPFELTAALLLAAVVGAVAIAKRDRAEGPPAGADT
ncbi:MAG: NADH-quinone oxidoreductase subunit J, partial [candidate division Zixibacteria bacterium]|nr:NADH-quinone oxidoreductase subunit J [candidate division Zixibacteria bacterium]